ncbi:unnamed protein product [Amoebophrya sp. A120]|nr:unnamed protein product [Amoebophrya sp. A120]|eukprot:GSA120T00002168001.1
MTTGEEAASATHGSDMAAAILRSPSPLRKTSGRMYTAREKSAHLRATPASDVVFSSVKGGGTEDTESSFVSSSAASPAERTPSQVFFFEGAQPVLDENNGSSSASPEKVLLVDDAVPQGGTNSLAAGSTTSYSDARSGSGSSHPEDIRRSEAASSTSGASAVSRGGVFRTTTGTKMMMNTAAGSSSVAKDDKYKKYMKAVASVTSPDAAGATTSGQEPIEFFDIATPGTSLVHSSSSQMERRISWLMDGNSHSTQSLLLETKSQCSSTGPAAKVELSCAKEQSTAVHPVRSSEAAHVVAEKPSSPDTTSCREHEKCREDEIMLSSKGREHDRAAATVSTCSEQGPAPRISTSPKVKEDELPASASSVKTSSTTSSSSQRGTTFTKKFRIPPMSSIDEVTKTIAASTPSWAATLDGSDLLHSATPQDQDATESGPPDRPIRHAKGDEASDATADDQFEPLVSGNKRAKAASVVPAEGIKKNTTSNAGKGMTISSSSSSVEEIKIGVHLPPRKFVQWPPTSPDTSDNIQDIEVVLLKQEVAREKDLRLAQELTTSELREDAARRNKSHVATVEKLGEVQSALLEKGREVKRLLLLHGSTEKENVALRQEIERLRQKVQDGAEKLRVEDDLEREETEQRVRSLRKQVEEAAFAQHDQRQENNALRERVAKLEQKIETGEAVVKQLRHEKTVGSKKFAETKHALHKAETELGVVRQQLQHAESMARVDGAQGSKEVAHLKKHMLAMKDEFLRRATEWKDDLDGKKAELADAQRLASHLQAKLHEQAAQLEQGRAPGDQVVAQVPPSSRPTSSSSFSAESIAIQDLEARLSERTMRVHVLEKENDQLRSELADFRAERQRAVLQLREKAASYDRKRQEAKEYQRLLEQAQFPAPSR